MTLTKALQSAQFVVDQEGRRTAVLLDIRAWDTLINWVEDIIDTKITAEAFAELEAAGGRPQQAGWLDWMTIREEWRAEEERAIEKTAI